MNSIQCVNNELSMYNNNNTNRTCYCYTISDEEREMVVLKHFIKMCDICLMLFTLIVIGIQYLEIINEIKGDILPREYVVTIIIMILMCAII